MNFENQKKNYIFLDESGKPEVYSSKGRNLIKDGVASKFLVLTAVRTSDQLNLQQNVTKFKADLLADTDLSSLFSSNYSLDSFHAKVDFPEIKEKFYKFINTLNVKIDVIVVEKELCSEALKFNPAKMYGVMSGQLLKKICHQSINTEIIFSRKDSKLKARQELEAEVERVRLEYSNFHNLKTNFKLTYFHNPHYTHAGLQIADYVAYAVFQVFERQNNKWFKIIEQKIGNIQDICNKKYFTWSNPLKLST